MWGTKQTGALGYDAHRCSRIPGFDLLKALGYQADRFVGIPGRQVLWDCRPPGALEYWQTGALGFQASR